MRWKKILAGLIGVAVLAFGAYHAYLYSLDLYASRPVFETARGAVDGYDVVAYFTDSKPTPGMPEFSTEWNGARWQFASAGNRAAFIADPQRYAPQFGGYCAWAVSSGYTAKSDPQAWHIENGKLYLNFNAEVREAWMSQRSERIAAAVRNWPRVIED